MSDQLITTTQEITWGISIVASIILPLIFKWWPERKPKKCKEDFFAEELSFAEVFCELINEDIPILVKDRATQKLLHRKDISFTEAKFFYHFRNMESLLSSYMNVRSSLSVKYNDGEVVELELPKMYKLQRCGLFFLYAFCIGVGTLPLNLWNYYNYLLEGALKDKNYLILAELYVLPFLFIIAGLIVLNKYENYGSAKKFLEKIESIKK